MEAQHSAIRPCSFAHWSRRFWASFMAFVLVWAPGWSHAQQGDVGAELLEQGIRSYDNLELRRSATALLAAIGAPDLNAAQRAQAYLYLGLVRFEQGNEVESRRAFASGFRLKPDMELPSGVSPKVRSIARRIRTKAILVAEAQQAKTKEPSKPPVERLPKTITEEERAAGVLEAGTDEGETRVEVEAVVPRQALASPPELKDEDQSGPPWLWIGLGGGVAAAGIAALVILAVSGDNNECGDRGGAGGCVVFTVR